MDNVEEKIAIEDLVELQEDQVVTDSRNVAEHFEKEHAKVIRSIESIISETPKMASQKMFHETTYKVKGNNKSYKMYLMNRDGFSLLVMGFTGKAALEWKLKYINAFNKMEQKLKEQNENINDSLLKFCDAVNHNLENHDKMLDLVEKTVDATMEEHKGIVSLIDRAMQSLENIQKSDRDIRPSEDAYPRDGEDTMEAYARYYNWYTRSGNPHTRFLRAILQHCLHLNMSAKKSHEDDYIRCAVAVDESGVTKPHFFLKQKGFDLLAEWCKKTNNGETLRKYVRYQRNTKTHKVGDIRQIYYMIEYKDGHGHQNEDKFYLAKA